MKSRLSIFIAAFVVLLALYVWVHIAEPEPPAAPPPSRVEQPQAMVPSPLPTIVLRKFTKSEAGKLSDADRERLNATLLIPEVPDDPYLAAEQRRLINDYLNAGSRNAEWDQQVVKALVTGSRLGRWNYELQHRDFYNACKEAIDKGCNDPLVFYFYLRMYSTVRYDTRSAQLQASFFPVLDDLLARDYSAYTKFTACCRAAQYAAEFGSTPELKKRHKNFIEQAYELLPKTLEEKTVPLDESFELMCEFWINEDVKISGDRKASMLKLYPILEKADKAFALAIKGKTLVQYAWDARGTGFASTVSSQNFKLFGQRLYEARAALEESWELDPKKIFAPRQMVTVAMGLSLDRKEMETWFKRSIAADPNDADVYGAKFTYLQPRWHGSVEDVVAFGQECIKAFEDNPTAQPMQPEMYVYALENLASDFVRAKRGRAEDFFSKPEIWRDVKRVYELLLKRFPKSTRIRTRYALHAASALQYKLAKDQIDALGEEIDIGVFGNETGLRQFLSCVEWELKKKK